MSIKATLSTLNSGSSSKGGGMTTVCPGKAPAAKAFALSSARCFFVCRNYEKLGYLFICVLL
jgi:hypothetical protein